MVPIVFVRRQALNRIFCVTKEAWKNGDEIGQGEVSKLFGSNIERPGYFQYHYLTKCAEQATSTGTVFVTMPGVLKRKAAKPTRNDLRDVSKSRYMYTTGDGYGSLVDPVTVTHGTRFPSIPTAWEI